MHLYFPAQTESRALNLCNTATINSLAHFPHEQIEQTWGVDLVNRHNIRCGNQKVGLLASPCSKSKLPSGCYPTTFAIIIIIIIIKSLFSEGTGIYNNVQNESSFFSNGQHV